MCMAGESQAILQAPDQHGVSINGSQGGQWWGGPVVGPCLYITHQPSASTFGVAYITAELAASIDDRCIDAVGVE